MTGMFACLAFVLNTFVYFPRWRRFNILRTFWCGFSGAVVRLRDAVKGRTQRFQDADDLLYADRTAEWSAGKRIDTSNAHETGCTLSSVIASNLAKSFSLRESVKRTKKSLSGAFSAQMNLGSGSGPVDQGFCLSGYFSESAVLSV